MHSHLARPANTATAYRRGIEALAQYLGELDAETRRPFAKKDTERQPKAEVSVSPRLRVSVSAVLRLLDMPRGAAERTVHDFVEWLHGKYGALNTVRTRAQSIMGLVRLAHKLDVIPWMLQPLKLPSPELIRDTRGPTVRQVSAMIEACRRRRDAKGARDLALVELMAHGAYRCNEVLSLDVCHVDTAGRTPTIQVLAKGKRGRTRYPIPRTAAVALAKWLEIRGTEAGPVFVSLDRAIRHLGFGTRDSENNNQRDARNAETRNPAAARLSYSGAHETIAYLGRAAGIKCSPHKLRHHAATEILRKSKGDIPLAMALTRHANPKTLMIYNDIRQRNARNAMRIISRVGRKGTKRGISRRKPGVSRRRNGPDNT